jgi:DNA-binding GntR family transcriptional regulator
MTAAEQPDPRAYMRLAAFIREQISDGKLGPGGRLPSIAVLRREQGHSRQTAGKAMHVLADEGLIYRVPGLGYYVSRDVSAGPGRSSPLSGQIADMDRPHAGSTRVAAIRQW